jgi:hypothetical protein
MKHLFYCLFAFIAGALNFRAAFRLPLSVFMGTVPTGTVQTVAMVGVRESLLDELSIISPALGVFYNALGSGKKPLAVKHEFLTDTIRASADNAVIEGDDPTINASTQPSRIFNYCQIQQESYAVSSTANAVKTAGRATEKDLQRRKHMEGLTKDMNRAFLKGVLVAPLAGTAGKMKGALNWTVTNLNKGAAATLNADGTVTGGTPRALTTVILKSVMQNMFTTGASDKSKTLRGFCNATQQSTFDAVAYAGGNQQRFIEGSKVDDYVDVYVTAFGKIVTELDVEMPIDQFFICNMSYWKKAVLEGIGEVKLATSSALSEKYHITVNHTLEARNEASSGRITDLT